MGERVDMDVLAERLGVSRETLREWCGEREELLGEVLASLSQALLAHAVAENRHVTGGVGRLLAVYRQFVCTLVNAQPLQIFLQQEPQAALQILTSSSGHVQPRLVRSIHELLSQEQEAGAFALKTDARSLAYAIVRLTEAFLYNDAILATEPQIERAVRLVALLID
jgi:AcrR family transcriptional regulator